ncbi:MAG: two-component sensor histidine kinase, partial [Rhizobacter sp.]
MSKSRVGSLGRRLSSWLALQSLAGLAVVCVAVYAVTYVNLAARQLETIAQKETQVRHLLEESTRDGDVAMLKHKLDDFFIGHQDLALSLQRRDGSVVYGSAAAATSPEAARVVRFEVSFPTATSNTLTATLALDTRD